MPLTKDAAPTSAIKGALEPHDKIILTSSLGRAIERASYVDLILAASGVLLLGSVYFSRISSGNGLATNGHAVCPDFLEALYFCVITFTTLGYGDLSPIGRGRIAAALIVTSGLILTALLIGKFASERQQSTLLLLYTSDAQRRLESFTSEIEKLRAQLRSQVLTSRGAKRLRETLQSLENLVEATFSYAIFNANQARLVEFGNASALNALYRGLASVQSACATIHKSSLDDVVASDSALALTRRLSVLMNVMAGFHRKKTSSYTSAFIARIRITYLLFKLRSLERLYAWVKSITAHKRNTALTVKKKLQIWVVKLELQIAKADTGVHVGICKEMKLVACDLDCWVERVETPSMLSKVLKVVPPGLPEEWPRNLNSQIGGKLKITNALAGRCIKSLRQQGRLPKV